MTIPHQIVVRRVNREGSKVVYDHVEYDYGYVTGRGTPAERASAHALARLEDWLSSPHAAHPPGEYRLTAYRVREPNRALGRAVRLRVVASVAMTWPPGPPPSG